MYAERPNEEPNKNGSEPWTSCMIFINAQMCRRGKYQFINVKNTRRENTQRRDDT